MKKLIIANWKMNPASEAEAVRLARSEDFRNVVIAPPFPLIPAVKRALRKSALGAQDVFWKEGGAYTGEVSPRQLKLLGAKYVIIGHSERRALGETDKMVNEKVKAALNEGLKVILCVGESWSVRKKGLAAAKRFVGNQLKKDLAGVNRPMKLKAESLAIAYEPVWAIGTGRADRPKETAEIAVFIKRIIKTKVLYGGSVKAKNVARFLNQEEIGGALVGGASLNPFEFGKIIRAAR